MTRQSDVKPLMRTPAASSEPQRRPAGVADWVTARLGNTERTLTAAAGPSPCGHYRHALHGGRPERPGLFFLD